MSEFEGKFTALRDSSLWKVKLEDTTHWLAFCSKTLQNIRPQKLGQLNLNSYFFKERAFYCLNEQFVPNMTEDVFFFGKVLGTL